MLILWEVEEQEEEIFFPISSFLGCGFKKKKHIFGRFSRFLVTFAKQNLNPLKIEWLID